MVLCLFVLVLIYSVRWRGWDSMVKTEMPWFRHLSFCASCATFLARQPRPWLHHDMQFIHFTHHHPSYTLILSMSRLSSPHRTISPSLQVDRDEHFSWCSFHGAHTPNLRSSYPRIMPATPGPQIAFGLWFWLVLRRLPACANWGSRDQDMADVIWKWYCLRSWIHTWTSSKCRMCAVTLAGASSSSQS